MKVFPRQRLAKFAVEGMQSGDKTLARKVAAYLVREGRTSEVNSLARDILQLQADNNGIIELTAVSAHPIESSSRDKLEEMVRQTHQGVKKVVINEKNDKDVVGGVRLEFANELLDNTVDARLNSLREKTKL